MPSSAAIWEIAGVAGASLDATKRTLEALGRDLRRAQAGQPGCGRVFVFSAGIPALRGRAGSGTGDQPLAGRDARFFPAWSSGPNTRPCRIPRPVVKVACKGGWWWLEQTALTSDQTDDAETPATAERPVLGIPAGTTQSAIATILARAITLGAQIAAGSIATGYNIPGITLPNMSAADALAEVLRWLPDAMTWVDYSGTGTPRSTSRAAAPPRPSSSIWTPARPPPAGGNPVEAGVVSAALAPRQYLQLSGVKIGYTQRDATGRATYKQVVAGTSSPGSARRRVIVVSGPELDTYLPRNVYESANPKTISLSADAAAGMDLALQGWDLPAALSGVPQSQPDIDARHVMDLRRRRRWKLDVGKSAIRRCARMAAPPPGCQRVNRPGPHHALQDVAAAGRENG